jgi:hypothetical protein
LPTFDQNIMRSTYAPQGEANYKPLLLKLALVALAADVLATLVLRGFIVLPALRRTRAGAAAASGEGGGENVAQRPAA